MQTHILRGLLAVAILLSAGWWIYSDDKWEPVISGVLALVGLLSIGRVERRKTPRSGAAEDGLVVLPFAEPSSETADGSFADALTEELVRSLSQIGSLRVISATSSLRLKDMIEEPRTIAAELGVRYVLSGRLGRRGDAIRISAELIDATDATQIWSDRYSVPEGDLTDLQERLGRAITDALQVQLSSEEDRNLGERAIGNPRAHQCYLRAQQEIYTLTEDSLQRAIQLLQNGVSITGPNELLLATLGDAYFQLYNVVDPVQSYLDQAEEYARRALDLNPDSAAALSVMGLTSYKSRADIPAAVRWLRRSLRSDPVNTVGLFWISYFYAHAGRCSKAHPLVRRLLELDPLIPINHGVAGLVEVMDGEFSQAVPLYRKWHEMNPDHPFSLWAFAGVLIAVGKKEQAFSLLDRLPTSDPPSLWDRLGLAFRCGLREDSKGVLEEVTPDVSSAIRSHEQFSWHASRFYALAGLKDESLASLEDAMELGFINYPFISTEDPFLENVRSDPRFAELMIEMKTKWEAFDA